MVMLFREPISIGIGVDFYREISEAAVRSVAAENPSLQTEIDKLNERLESVSSQFDSTLASPSLLKTDRNLQLLYSNEGTAKLPRAGAVQDSAVCNSPFGKRQIASSA